MIQALCALSKKTERACRKGTICQTKYAALSLSLSLISSQTPRRVRFSKLVVDRFDILPEQLMTNDDPFDRHVALEEITNENVVACPLMGYATDK